MVSVSTTDHAFFKPFFHLSESFERDAARVRLEKEIVESFSLSVFKGAQRPVDPLTFRQVEGHRLLDLVGSTWQPLRLVSNRFTDTLRQSCATGWDQLDVVVQDALGQSVRGFSLLVVTGSCGPIHDRLSARVTLPRAVAEGEDVAGLKGLFFESKTWDGSDVFSPLGTAYVFISEKVKTAIREAGLTNARIESLLDVERVAIS